MNKRKGKKFLLNYRNEFLEEALNASNDMVVQLRHDLQTRSNLLRFYIDYDIDLDGCTAGFVSFNFNLFTEI